MIGDDYEQNRQEKLRATVYKDEQFFVASLFFIFLNMKHTSVEVKFPHGTSKANKNKQSTLILFFILIVKFEKEREYMELVPVAKW